MSTARSVSSWLLLHKGNPSDVRYLYYGKNTIGRHSECDMRYKFEFLSRRHAEFIVKEDDTVAVSCLNSTNGVFVNGEKLNGTTRQLVEKDVINIGVIVEPNTQLGIRDTIFELRKKNLPGSGECITISDESDSESVAEVVEVNKASSKPLKTSSEISKKTTDDASNTNDLVQKNKEIIASTKLHMPQLPTIKAEKVQMVTNDITDIFGNPNEHLLSTVCTINKYLYNNLTKNDDSTNTNVQVVNALVDGEVIDISKDDADDNNQKMHTDDACNTNQNNTTITPLFEDCDDDDDEEQLYLTQNILDDIKKELEDEQADADSDIDDIDINSYINSEISGNRLDISSVAQDLATEQNNNDTDSDEELHSKVNDWSFKILSQVYEPNSSLHETIRPKIEPPDDSEINALLDDILINDLKGIWGEADCENDNNAVESVGENDNNAVEPENDYDSQFPYIKSTEKIRKSRKLSSSSSSSNESVNVISDQLSTNEIQNITGEKSASHKKNKTNETLTEKDTSNKQTHEAEVPITTAPDKSCENDNDSQFPYIKSTEKISKSRKLSSSSSSSDESDNVTSDQLSTNEIQNITDEKSASHKKNKTNETLTEKDTSNKQPHEAEVRITTAPDKSCEESNSVIFKVPVAPITKKVNTNAEKRSNVNEQEKTKETQQKNKKILQRRSSICSPSLEKIGRHKITEVSSTKELPTKTDNSIKKLNFNETKAPVTITPDKSSEPSKSNGIKVPVDAPTTKKDNCIADKTSKVDEREKAKETQPKNKKILQRRFSICSPSLEKIGKRKNSEESESTACKPKVTDDFDFELFTAKPTSANRGPEVIDAISLPTGRGKLRGVSAVKDISKTLNSIRNESREERNVKELKQKWLSKPSTGKKELDNIKKQRKERLRQVAEAEHHNDSDKAKESNDNKRKFTNGQVGAKNSCVNRGAFLTEDVDQQPPCKKAFKIPKIPEDAKTSTKVQPIPNSPCAVKRTHQRTVSIDSFSQQLTAPDRLMRPTCDRKDAIAARAKRTTNKITFTAMEKHFEAKCRAEEKMNTNRNLERNAEKMSTGGQEETNKRICFEAVGDSASISGKPKKNVNFDLSKNLIYEIESVPGATRQVFSGVKDFAGITTSTYSSRREAMLKKHKMNDYTYQIINDILQWCNQWLDVANAEQIAATERIMPMPNSFVTFDHYKNVIMPLMKLEFQSTLERACRIKNSSFIVRLENFFRKEERYILVTKYAKTDINKFDLYTMEFDVKCAKPTFAYLQMLRKGSTSCCTIVFEILAEHCPADVISKSKNLTIRPIIDNIRVEFGAFNAVYQLENTPLYKAIINPLELIPPKCGRDKKLAAYRGKDKLSDEQIETLLQTYIKIIDERKSNITLIQGPPGTGKSILIINLVLQCLYGMEVHFLDRKILLCSQSNEAINNLTRFFQIILNAMSPRSRFRLVRFGLTDKMCPSSREASLQHYLEKAFTSNRNNNFSEESKENLRYQQSKIEAEILHLKQNINRKGTSLDLQLLAKQKELKQIRDLLNNRFSPEEEFEMSKYLLKNANIVCTTLSSCVKLAQYVDYFDICIIDEATQCTEPWTLLPLRFGMPSMVLVGDTQQLPATVLSKKANDFGLSKSMFARIQNCLELKGKGATDGIIYKLSTQYRMHPEICKWPNQYFYENTLQNAINTISHTTKILPYFVINLTYTKSDNRAHGKITNKEEADFVAKLVQFLLPYLSENYTYGIITPYLPQCDVLKQALKNSNLPSIMTSTIDAYQGQQRDVIILSNARTAGVGFLSNYQRLNVALTRAKRCLILVGNFQNLEGVPVWLNLLKNARDRKLYFELDQNMVKDLNTNLINKLVHK